MTTKHEQGIPWHPLVKELAASIEMHGEVAELSQHGLDAWVKRAMADDPTTVGEHLIVLAMQLVAADLTRCTAQVLRLASKLLGADAVKRQLEAQHEQGQQAYNALRNSETGAATTLLGGLCPPQPQTKKRR